MPHPPPPTASAERHASLHIWLKAALIVATVMSALTEWALFEFQTIASPPIVDGQEAAPARLTMIWGLMVAVALAWLVMVLFFSRQLRLLRPASGPKGQAGTVQG